ncbi:hypothetical protein [Nonomuraea glycinis]|uniref:hypothetical protein n=1 Tax=Nonomuraea glycinis TaxID=2047744 RepID=UPI0033A4069B
MCAPGSRRSATHPIEQLGGQLVDVRAAVEQEQPARHHRQQRVVIAAEPVTPLGQDGPNLGDLVTRPVVPEDLPGQGETLEAAEPIKTVNEPSR